VIYNEIIEVLRSTLILYKERKLDKKKKNKKSVKKRARDDGDFSNFFFNRQSTTVDE
jgi:hypothetical protein